MPTILLLLAAAGLVVGVPLLHGRRTRRAALALVLCLGLTGCGTALDGAATGGSALSAPGASAARAESPGQTGVAGDRGSAAPTGVSQGDVSFAATKEQEGPAANRVRVELVEVVDGDTIKVRIGGRVETVRFLLVDTPETVHPSKPVQPFGPEASAFTKSVLNGAAVVELERDVSERDKYGRLLAYVYADGRSVQELLLERGLARVAYVYPPDIKYVDHYRAIQRAAQERGVGIWSLENYTLAEGAADDDAPVPATDQVGGGQSSAGQSSAGQSSVGQSGGAAPPLRYDPRGPDRDCGDFATQAEAQAFFLAAGGPGQDPHRLDNDKDGVACETLP
jgi:micrococcal nuclease